MARGLSVAFGPVFRTQRDEKVAPVIAAAAEREGLFESQDVVYGPSPMSAGSA
jgi:hypothetical protein